MQPPKFKEGQIIRYAKGPTALMKVTAVNFAHAGTKEWVRYHGEHCMGGSVGAYEIECASASLADIQTWDKYYGGGI